MPDGETHALVTGPISGHIPHRFPHGDGTLDVTPDVLYFDTVEEAQAAADSIEAEHAVRGTHPIQEECPVLDGHPDKKLVAAHRAAHKALNKKAGL
jgi:hypothetical protein